METKIFIGICIFCVVAFFFLAICDVVKYAIISSIRYNRHSEYNRGMVNGFKMARQFPQIKDVRVAKKDEDDALTPHEANTYNFTRYARIGSIDTIDKNDANEKPSRFCMVKLDNVLYAVRDDVDSRAMLKIAEVTSAAYFSRLENSELLQEAHAVAEEVLSLLPEYAAERFRNIDNQICFGRMYYEEMFDKNTYRIIIDGADTDENMSRE